MWQLLKKFSEHNEGLMADVADNDPSDPSDTAFNFGRHLSAEAAELLRLAVEKQQLSAQGFYKVIRVARTIANLGQSQQVGREDVAEALAYRMMPLLTWVCLFFSMVSQVVLAIFTPDKLSISRIPVGEVTFISVR